MKSKKRLLIACTSPWIVVGAVSLRTFIMISINLLSCDLQTVLLTLSCIAIAINLVTAMLYVTMPYFAGAFCVWLAKHWKLLDGLANYSAAMMFDVQKNGNYTWLYNKGVKTYNMLNRSGSPGPRTWAALTRR